MCIKNILVSILENRWLVNEPS